jgi:hypothetical protein
MITLRFEIDQNLEFTAGRIERQQPVRQKSANHGRRRIRFRSVPAPIALFYGSVIGCGSNCISRALLFAPFKEDGGMASNQEKQHRLDRRSFLKSLGLGIAAATVGAYPIAKASVKHQRHGGHTGKLRFGVNYIPSKHWWYSWMNWDRHAIAEDLRAIAGLGFDHIRIQLLWPIFQPDPNVVNDAALRHLRELLDCADSGPNLDVEVTVLDGWLSGFDFEPAWRKGKQMLTDDRMIDAELRLFDALAEVIGSHPRFLGFDLGNELDVINGSISPKQGDAWLRRILKHCEAIAPGRLHVNGADQLPWFKQRTFSQRALVTTGSASTFHAWVYFAGALKRYGLKGTGTLHLGEYMSELASAFATDLSDLSRPTWMEEFGAIPNFIPVDDIPDLAEASSRNAMSSANLWGWTWWASHDIDRRFKGFDPLEYRLGVLTVDNKVKPVGRRFAKLIPEWRTNPPQPAVRETGLVLTNPKRAGLEFADHFFNLIDDGVRPAIVLNEKVEDQAYLAARGIKKLIRP